MRYNVEYIQNEANQLHWKLLSTEYKNLQTDLIFECPEGHKVFISYGDWRKKQICPICEKNIYKQMEETAPAPKKNKDVYRIIAFDQSSRISGYSVFDDKELITYGTYVCTKNTHLERMVDISDWITSMIRKFKPDQVGFEEVQYNPNVGMGHDVFKLLAQVLGASMLTAARENVKVCTVLIPSWRKHCGVKGRERAQQKRNAQNLIKQWYDISVNDDIADAICQGKYYSDKHWDEERVLIGDWIE